jgi:hypothetical protein
MFSVVVRSDSKACTRAMRYYCCAAPVQTVRCKVNTFFLCVFVVLTCRHLAGHGRRFQLSLSLATRTLLQAHC